MKNTFSQARTFIRHHPLITGALYLTGAGFLSRIIGFFYRIYLSRIIGEEGMGIYQMIHPLGALAFSLTGASFQTAISKFVAGQVSKNKSPKPLFLGACMSIPLSLLTALCMYLFADSIALHYLHEPRTTSLIRLLAFTVPFSAVHACINGYFYGIKQASVPAWTQLTEQIFRVGSVFFFSTVFTVSVEENLSIAVIGLIIGEIAGFAISLFIFSQKNGRLFIPFSVTDPSPVTVRALLTMIIPLSANRIILSFLQSIESTILPYCLRRYGYDPKTALSVYGVLTGMAFPLIFFPNALTGSISVLLLPVISENTALKNHKEIRKIILQTIQYCSVFGFICMAFFLFFAKPMGIHIFNSPLAGFFIGELSFLCPFLYLNSTLSSIIQGIGKATSLFAINLTTLLLRLCMIFLLVPQVGIKGYLWGLLASQILSTTLYLCRLFIS